MVQRIRYFKTAIRIGSHRSQVEIGLIVGGIDITTTQLDFGSRHIVTRVATTIALVGVSRPVDLMSTDIETSATDLRRQRHFVGDRDWPGVGRNRESPG